MQPVLAVSVGNARIPGTGKKKGFSTPPISYWYHWLPSIALYIVLVGKGKVST